MLPCLTLSIIRYRSRVCEAIQGKELSPSLQFDVVAIEKGAYGSPSTMIGQLPYIDIINYDRQLTDDQLLYTYDII